MTAKEFAFTALRIISAILFIKIIPKIPEFFYIMSETPVSSDADAAAAVTRYWMSIFYYAVMIIIILLFWFKAEFLSTFFVTKNKDKAVESDWYGVAMVTLGIYIFITYIEVVFISFLELNFYWNDANRDNVKYTSVRLAISLLQCVIGLALVVKKDNLLQFVHKIRRR